ncbi:hypothetical protein [Streptomyces sp. NPDC018833]|uniref:hypothetical protein n=1 Tax=Streptomyces sp. NPDC018833 TaxID=3365053 RepID=UPI0037929F53
MDDGSNASVATITGSGVAGGHPGNATTTQKVATVAGASNRNNTASANGCGLIVVDQGNITVGITHLWWCRPARGGPAERGERPACATVLRHRRAGRRPGAGSTAPAVIVAVALTPHPS